MYVYDNYIKSKDDDDDDDDNDYKVWEWFTIILAPLCGVVCGKPNILYYIYFVDLYCFGIGNYTL